MCGIAGSVADRGTRTREHRLRAALARLRHRGPDDMGAERRELAGSEVWLGQTRLSVIDLSRGGHQPMVSADGRYVLVFNGELYNYLELREELIALGEVFATSSDTEVLLVAWGRWGRASLRRFRGMFAFAILDAAELKLTCVRDAFGIKPLHYALADHDLVFASEIPALLDLIGAKVEVNQRQAFRYLEYGFYDDSEETFVEGVYKLRPGSLLEYDLVTRAVVDRHQWWSPGIEERTDLDFATAAERLRELILDSVLVHLRSDVPLGVALSGGIDSSVVVAAMRRIAPDAELHTFSYVANGSSLNEEPWIDLMNAAVQAVPHKVAAGPQDLARDLEAVILAQGEPFASTSIYAQYRVFQSAREAGITVTLDGQGADELLAGYAGYPAQRIMSLLSRGDISGATRFLSAWGEWPGRRRRSLIRSLLGQPLSPPLKEAVRTATTRQKWMQSQGNHRPPENALPAAEARRGRYLATALREGLMGQGLEALLRHADRNSMAFSVESRVPFLTVDIAEFLLTLPEDYLIGPDGQTKRILRAAMKGIAPDEVLDRRDKIGFETPQRDWIRQQGSELSRWLDSAHECSFLDHEYVRAKFLAWVAGARTNVDHDSVWRLLNYCRWLEALAPHLRF